jgi:hypothetical protein
VAARATATNKVYYGDIVYDPTGNAFQVVAKKTAQGGVVAGYSRLNNLFQLFRSVQTIENEQTFITNAQGVILYHSDSQRVGQQLPPAANNPSNRSTCLHRPQWAACTCLQQQRCPHQLANICRN